ncbi:MAG: organoarsenical effux MFS transporter ArsJ [Gammaproteobacteria bacterium]|nr:organoarsenical effux MFS transporter ArsJ [Gammaproteobacteria bacterium]
MSDSGFRNYLVVTAGYWAFTVTDGAIRMLVVLYFHQLGYSPFQVALLFLFYEAFGLATNLVGGWLGARIGLNLTMHIGMALQVAALLLLTVPDPWLSVAYVMAVQAISGIAKDLNKMSAKASVKVLAGAASESRLFRYVAVLTGSKNALKGAGFFIGAALLDAVGFRMTLVVLAVALAMVLLLTVSILPRAVGVMSFKPKFTEVFSKRQEINWLSAARFFLFGARDVWFVVGLPVFLYETLGWSFTEVGGFFALWIIGYGTVQALAPQVLRQSRHGRGPGGGSARRWVALLTLVPATMAVFLQSGEIGAAVVVGGLVVFAIVFAINSAVHSYLVLAYSDSERVALNVGFYYMANAGGRLVGTLLSGAIYQVYGLTGCLWWSTAFLAAAWLASQRLPEPHALVSSVRPGGN